MMEILSRAGAIIAIGLLVLSAARFVIVFSLAIQQTDAAATMAKLIIFFIPHYVGFMLPLSLYWSTFLTFRRLTESNEVVSFAACGISPVRSAAPLMALAIAFTAANAVVFGWLEPWARYQYRSIKYQLEQSELYVGAQAQTFLKIGDRTILIEAVNHRQGTIKGFFMFETGRNGTQRTVTAPSGHITESRQSTVLTIHDGQRLAVTAMPLGVAGTGPVAPAASYASAAVIDVPIFGPEKPYPPRGDDEHELYLNELWASMDTPRPRATAFEMASEYHRKMVIILTSLVLPMLAMLIARSTWRTAKLYRNAVAIVSGAVYYELVETGEIICKRLGLAPAPYFWAIFAIALLVPAGWLAWINVTSSNPWTAVAVWLRQRRAGMPGSTASQPLM